jgi:AcrR family transcriptional regulator
MSAQDHAPAEVGTTRPGAGGRPTGPDDVTTAILDAATDLFTERSPATVSLREIARRADVNYGLIHRYYGSKEAVVAAVFRRKSEAGAQVIANARNSDEALGLLMSSTGGRAEYARLLAGALVADTTSEAIFSRSPAVERLTELIRRDHGDADERDPRVVAAAAMALSVGWSFFEPFYLAAADLSDRDPDEVRGEVLDLVRAMVRSAG